MVGSLSLADNTAGRVAHSIAHFAIEWVCDAAGSRSIREIGPKLSWGPGLDRGQTSGRLVSST